MTPDRENAVARLSVAQEMRKRFEAEGVSDREERLYLKFLNVYIRDHEHLCGLRNTYVDDLDRLHELRNGIRATDPIFDILAGIPNPLPVEAATVLAQLTEMTFELARTIWAIEIQYPEWAGAFEADRLMYSEWQAGRGPLAGTDWHTDL